jgi:hypothetical protein
MLAHLFLLKPGLDGTSERLGREHSEPLQEREGWYNHAATLEVEPRDDVMDTLQAIWARTQHGRGDWTGNAEVRWVSGPSLRSSHVGDVIVLEGSGDRAAFEIAFADFRRIDVPAGEIPSARTAPPLPGEVE